jgi:60 kDa SS-A/Ro ribonucleoprotein
LQYIVKGQVAAAGADEAEAVVGDFDPEMDKVMRFLQAVEDAKKCEDEAAMAALIVEHRLAREHVPSGLLQSTQVWAAMLPSMPLTAMIRNLGKMTSIGLLKPLSDHTATVVAKLEDKNALKRARVHPFSVLEALHTYRSGGGRKGSLKWDPTPEVAAALERAFYLSFGAVTPTGKRFVLGLDVSGSMGFQPIANSSITPMQGAAAMAMVTMRTEKRCSPMAFSHRLVPTGITAADSLETVLRKMESIPMGGTDCALPMIWALENGVDADVFIVYTDNETWAGATTPADALRQYRASSGIDAKLIVVGMTSGGFSIADPDDAGMMDVVGFDSNAPSVMQDFVTGGM